jgi:hypothetical protein
MKYQQLIRHSGLLTELKKNAPLSPYSGKPLSLTHGALDLTWENSGDPDWWHGANEMNYSRQVRRAVRDEDIIEAATRAGINAAEIYTAIISRVEEKALLDAEANQRAQKWSAEEAAKNAERSAAARQAYAAAHPELLDDRAAFEASSEMAAHLRTHPQIERMTRKLDLVTADGTKVAKFSHLAGMKAWLWQHGYRASIDDRDAFVASEK